MAKQIILIHGGNTFEKYGDYLKFLKTLEPSLDYLKKKSWKDSLQDKLGDGFDVIQMQMPNKLNSKYKEWKIYFDKYATLFNNEVILIGHSLGGIFLAKYLSENKFPKKITAAFLLSAPYEDKGMKESLGDFNLPGNLDNFSKQSDKILIYQSEDDTIVPVEHSRKYKRQLPNSELILLKNRGHLNQLEFPEIIEDIKKLS